MTEPKIERIKMVKAMEFIVRHINCEGIANNWLMYGIADGDIDYGDLSVSNEDEDILGFFIDDDEEFANLMHLFLILMKEAKRDGGIFCDGVVDKKRKED